MRMSCADRKKSFATLRDGTALILKQDNVHSGKGLLLVETEKELKAALNDRTKDDEQRVTPGHHFPRACWELHARVQWLLK